MKKILVFIFILLILPINSQASSISQRLSGRILLNVEQNGEAWYVNPLDTKRYYLGRPVDAFAIMRKLGLGVSEKNFEQITDVKTSTNTLENLDLTRKLAGRIILQTELNGEAWYINPIDLKKYYLGRPDDAFALMRKLGLGISRKDLALVHKPELTESIDQYSNYEHKKVMIKDIEFTVDLVKIDLNNPRLKIITATADNYNCKKSCQAKTLADFVVENNAFAGINGTYFDTSASKKNYSFYPVYNTPEKKLINDDQLKYWTTGPIVAFDEANKFYYFKDSREFASVENFEKTNNVTLQALMGNNPRLIDSGMNYLMDWNMDDKQMSVKAPREALAYKDNFVYLIVMQNATMFDLGDLLKSMEVEYALNLDGGYSQALFYNDEYMVGPGRNIPNVILFSLK